MKVLVCGSRHFNDWETMDGVLSGLLHEGDTLIHGCAKGADKLSEVWVYETARNQNWMSPTILRFPADWNKYGKAAGHIRNKQMLDEGKPDLVVAFMFKDSRGTKNMVEQAKKAGVKVEVINCEDN